MRKNISLYFILCFVCTACGGGGSDDSELITDPIDLKGRYVGTLSGTSCSTGSRIKISVDHTITEITPEDGMPVKLIDSSGVSYAGNFIIFAHTGGNLFGFSASTANSIPSGYPRSISYNFAGEPSGQALVVVYNAETLNGACDEYSGNVEKIN